MILSSNQRFLAKLLCNCIHRLAIATVDHKLHKLDELGIGTIHDCDAARSDLMIGCGEAAEDNVIEYKNGVGEPSSRESRERGHDSGSGSKG